MIVKTMKSPNIEPDLVIVTLPYLRSPLKEAKKLRKRGR